MTTEYSAQNLEELINKIAQHGFGIIDGFLPQPAVLKLADEIAELQDKALMQDAGTGRTSTTGSRIINKTLRGDMIYWLDDTDSSAPQQEYYKQMEAFRLQLNQQLYLGLFALESHLALYPAGSGYKKHIDRFATVNDGKAVRQISSILYLNQDWKDVDGGYLRLYKAPESDAEYLDILPTGGRLVVFLSDTFYHEVLPASRDRMSLTGWFLTR